LKNLSKIFILVMSLSGVPSSAADKPSPGTNAVMGEDRAAANGTAAQDEARATLRGSGASEADFKSRLSAMIALEMFPAVLKEATRYTKAFPKSADALAFRSQSNAILGNVAAAQQEAAQSIAIDPTNPVAMNVVRFYGYLNSIKNPRVEKIENFLSFSHLKTAGICNKKQDYACSIYEASEALHFNPNSVDSYLTIAYTYLHLHQLDKMTGQADLLVKAMPNDAEAWMEAGNIYCTIGRCSEGLQKIDKSIALKPSAVAYVAHMENLPRDDKVGRKRDIDAALTVEPKSYRAKGALLWWQLDNKDYVAAIGTMKSFPYKSGDDPYLKLQIAHTYVLAGMPDEARSAYGELRGLAASSKSAKLYNDICYEAATASFDLDPALADCQSALALVPESGPMLDSLGFVQLRLDRFDEAIEAYSHALQVMGNEAHSLYGRAIAHKRKGSSVASAADFAAARALNKDIDSEFLEFGIVP
jgi:tetratricopeptide (TPR) repeat protein